MISVYKIKPAFQKALQPILLGLRKMGISANQLTLFTVFFSIFLAYLLLQYNDHHYVLLLLAFGLLIRMALNALDGMMAKQFNMQSRLGEVLNEMGDVISDLVIVIPFIFLPGIEAWVIMLFAILSVINEYAGVLGKAMTGNRRFDGPMGKSDRAFLIGLLCLLAFFWPAVLSYANWIFGFGSLLIVYSTFIRLKKSIG